MPLQDLFSPSTALFLDFDGTLVDIAERPDAVVVPQDLIATLRGLHGYLGGALAVVSGRPVTQIDQYLAPLKLPTAGVHGSERRGADGQLRFLPVPSLERVETAARDLAARHPGLLVEAKRGSIALHYRHAPELELQCLDAMQTAVEESAGLTLLRGKMVAEAKPAATGKGDALEALMREAPFAGRMPVFVGDDTTDEAGFSSAQRLGGAGVKVGPGATVARQRVDSPQALREALDAVFAPNTAGAAA